MGEVVNMKERKSKEAAETEVASQETNGNQTPQKLTYEQLASAAQQLSEQGRQLYKRVQELEQALNETNLANLYKKMDYLWQVITSDSIYLDEDFKIACGKEFQTLMQGPSAEENEAPVEEEKKEEE